MKKSHPVKNDRDNKKNQSARSLQRWRHSAGFAWTGLKHAYQSQPNFRIEVWMAVLACVLAAVLDVPIIPILLCCALVLSLELVNTAIEALVDLASPDVHPLAKVAKDVAAAAVLVACFIAFLVGLVLFLPALWRLIQF